MIWGNITIRQAFSSKIGTSKQHDYLLFNKAGQRFSLTMMLAHQG
jgi:hypothetical protein